MLLLMVAGASALVFLSETSDGVMLLANEGYTAKLDMDNNTLSIGNILTVYQFPKTTVLGETIAPLEPVIGPIAAGERLDKLKIDYPSGLTKDVYVSMQLELGESFIQQEIKVENTHASEMTVELDLAPPTNDSYYVYLPSPSPPAKYVWVSTPFNQEKGRGVAVYFDTISPEYSHPGGTSLETGSSFFHWKMVVRPKEIKTVRVRYIVGYIADTTLMKQHAFNPPSNEQHVLDTDGDPLFDLSNEESLKDLRMGISASTAKEIVEKTKEKLDQLMDTPTSETQLTTTRYNFQELVGKSQLDSLEKSLMFREIVRKKGVPAELVIGSKGGSYYAWVYAYPTIDPILFDPAGKSKQYAEAYVEPDPPYCTGSVGSCDWTAGFDTGIFCLLNLCGSAYLFAGAALAFVIFMFLILQYKPDLVYKLSEKARPKSVEKESSGLYEIVDKGFEPENPLEEMVFKQLEKRMGNVDLATYEKETGFSQILIKATIEGLESKKVIRKL
jgi:hypothetical protein